MVSDPEMKAAEGRIQKAICRIREEIPSVKPLADVYEKILLERARFKAELPSSADIDIPAPNPFLFLRGVPLLAETSFGPFRLLLKHSPDRILLGLANVFPHLKPGLARLRSALESGRLRLERCLEIVTKDEQERIEEIAFRLQIEPLTLNIILGQVVKPFIEKLAESFSTPLEGLVWDKRYCPFCGCLPELSILKDAGGQRWLRCSLCGHEWRFMRMVCPCCESGDHDGVECYSMEGRPHEHVEICRHCKRYVLSIDVRDSLEDGVLDMASTGLLRLEILAQRKGFVPVALYPWNFAVQNDLSAETDFVDAEFGGCGSS
jgi:FdhE protein